VNNSVDWKAIKAEYIAGGIGYRKLAEKYGVSFSTLSQVAKREKWTDLRQQTSDKTDTDLVKSIGKRNAQRSAKINDLADKLLDKIGELMSLDVLDGKSIKNISSALKDIREIKGIKSNIDLREQEARIAKLQKEAMAEEKQDNEIKVTIEGGLEDYSK
jgi:transcriptional regulator with XRE-family HTH domain